MRDYLVYFDRPANMSERSRFGSGCGPICVAKMFVRDFQAEVIGPLEKMKVRFAVTRQTEDQASVFLYPR